MAEGGMRMDEDWSGWVFAWDDSFCLLMQEAGQTADETESRSARAVLTSLRENAEI
jgi:hypothetical protein